MKRKKLYKILGIDSQATAKEIQEAYRRLATTYHPNNTSGTDREAQEKKFHDIVTAYNVLSSPEKRSKYDQGYLDDWGDTVMPGFHLHGEQHPKSHPTMLNNGIKKVVSRNQRFFYPNRSNENDRENYYFFGSEADAISFIASRPSANKHVYVTSLPLENLLNELQSLLLNDPNAGGARLQVRRSENSSKHGSTKMEQLAFLRVNELPDRMNKAIDRAIVRGVGLHEISQSTVVNSESPHK